MLDEAEIRAVTLPLAAARTLPPDAYIQPDVFRAEVRTLFSKEWICVAREEQIPQSGDFRVVNVVDQPLIVVRSADGSIDALSAICPHRGMPIVSTHGNASSFSCPYHLWKFGIDGRLISAPLMDGAEGFPDRDCRLPGVRVETWQGFVFVNLDPDARPLNDRLAVLNTLVDGYDMRNMVIASSLDFDCPWNWKILVENFMEAYHHIGPHRDSVQPTHHAKDSFVSGSVADGWSVLHMPEAPNAAAQNEAGAELPMLPDLTDEQRRQILAAVVMPTFCWLNTPSVAFWYQLSPTAHDGMQLTIHTLLPRTLAQSESGAAIAEGITGAIRAVHLEDIAVNEGPWRGLHAPLTRQGRLSPLEASIWQLNQWWVARVCGAA